ncbi:hypothetical protein CAEBREN_32851 [Caenorhabditis brenneri]|uniref:Integrase catalytic domain-containing protein n=1 Tax=Caenorhabditis brenneri TaxID=135651 RepID=G0NBA6_CAEBE|nr:hypothetical protein CAEBREN_32851 [Caenorhabditis brenneri]
MSVPITGGLSGIPLQPVASPRTITPHHQNLVNIASRSDPPAQHGINSAHKIYDCESRSIQKFCAQSGRCIYCTSDQHRSIECDLASRRSTPAPSTVGSRSNVGTRFVPPRNASTPHGIDHIPPEQPEHSWRGASRRERLNKAMLNDRDSAPKPTHKEFSHPEESDESSGNEWTEAKDIVEKRDNSIRLPFKDVDAIIKPFEDKPKDYHRFTNMIQNMVISNSRLNDTMKFVLLEKKLAGKAKRYLIELNDPKAALMETMKSIHRAFSQDNSAVNSILRKFQELTFNSVEPRPPKNSTTEMRIFYRKGNKPTLSQVIDCFTDVLEDLTFPDRFTTDSASTKGRTKELANTVMAMDAVRPQNSPQNAETDQQQVNVSDASAAYRPVNVGYTGYHPPHPHYNNPSYFPVYPNNGSPAPQNWSYGQNSNGGQGSGNNQSNQSTKKGNPGNSARQNSKNTKVAKGPAPRPLGLMIGEQIETCYNSGIGWDKNFIAHTFCRTDQTPNKCCFMCGTGHSILQCPIPSYQVRQYLRDTNACHNCTKQGHATEDCQSKATCAYCQGKHNTGGCVFKEFYRDINNYPADAPRPRLGADTGPSKAHVSPPAALPTATQPIGSSDPMPTGAPKIISAKTSHLPFVALRTTDGKVLLALVDSGASLSVLSHDSADRLGLKTLATKELTIAGYSKTTTGKSNIYQVSFKTLEKPFKMFIAGAPRLPDTKYDVPPLEISDIRFLKDNQIDFEQLSIDRSFNNKSIDMILGNDLLLRLLGRSRRVLLPSERYIEMTPFAPIIYPPPRASVTATSGLQEGEMEAFVIEGFINMLQTPEKKSTDQMGTLINEISQLWKLENLGIEEPGPIENGKKDSTDFIAEFEKNITYDEDGNLLVALPWNGKQAPLASNRGIASRRLEQLILTLKKGKNLLKDYDEIIQTQLRTGIIEIVTDEMNGGPTYYIPHRVVVKLASLTTKLRIVLDASSKKSGEYSLNDCLEPGPSMLVDLLDILIRSRLSDYLVVADIEKAFHQVRMTPGDRDCTRFLWLKDISKPATRNNIIEYRFTQIPFGMTCSPFLLAATINHYLNEMNNEIGERIRQNLYVDNVMLTTDKKEEIQDLRVKSRAAFTSMGMNLRKFITNHLDEMAKFPADEVATETIIKLLGYQWDTVGDSFTIKLAHLLEDRPTKRQCASRMAETFDPLGLLAPLLVQFKLFLQDLWIDGLQWKDKILKDLLPRWELIRKQFSEVSISIPRMLRPRGDYERVHFMVFSDASKDTYACATYLLYEYAHGPPKIGLLAAKSKVKPAASTTLSIPRLELLAIEIGSQIAESAITAMGTETPSTIRFFSDSMVALYWILRFEQMKCWVNNRVTGIHEICGRMKERSITSSFHHCPTNLNPADLATRGMSASKLKDSSLWFSGPKFLMEPPSMWPCRLEGDVTSPTEFRELISLEIAEFKKKNKKTTEQLVVDREPELKVLTDALTGMCMTAQADEKYRSFVPYRRSNSLSKVISMTHSTLRCLTKMFKNHVWEGDIMKKFTASQGPLSLPTVALQRQAVARHLVMLEHYKEAESLGLKFPAKLDPVIGSDGIWRHHRRVPSPVLENEAHHLILVHKKHPLARLLMVGTHEKNAHAPVNYLVAALRSRFWIQAASQLADSVVRTCVSCQKAKNKAFPYPFSRKSPRFRTTPSTPFQHVGLDYLGPLEFIRDDGYKVGKAYCLVYTCLVTRAAHLELLPDASSETYIQGLINIFSRRGVPHSIYSDNAATFTLGARIISDNIRLYAPSQSMICFLAHHQIEFRHITPLAPWQGGIYERIVGVVKHQMRKEIGRSTKSFFVSSHILTRIENMINSRPLTPNPRQIDDLPALRPIDFIIPTALIDIPTERERSNSTSEFDPTYGRASSVIPRVGQIVLIYTEKLARHNWPLGRIETLQKSRDGLVRSATIRCRGKIYNRPINHLIPIEIEGCETFGDSDDSESGDPQNYLVPPDAPAIASFPISSKRLYQKDTVKLSEKSEEFGRSNPPTNTNDENVNDLSHTNHSSLSSQPASVDDLSSMDACLMSSGRKLKDDNTSPISNEQAGLMSSGRQLINSNHASSNRLASNNDLSSMDACLMSSGRKPQDDVTSLLSEKMLDTEKTVHFRSTMRKSLKFPMFHSLSRPLTCAQLFSLVHLENALRRCWIRKKQCISGRRIRKSLKFPMFHSLSRSLTCAQLFSLVHLENALRRCWIRKKQCISGRQCGNLSNFLCFILSVDH